MDLLGVWGCNSWSRGFALVSGCLEVPRAVVEILMVIKGSCSGEMVLVR